MKRNLVILGAAASLAVFSPSALASAQPSNAQLISEIHKISQETAALQGEVRSLKAQLRHRSRRRRRVENRSRSHGKHQAHASGVYGPVDTVHPAGSIYRPRITVTTSPWMGLPTHFRPFDLLERQGSMNEDLYLLQRKQHFIHELQAAGYDLDRPMVQLSGGVEGQAVQDFQSGNGSVNLGTVELDVNAVASSWANAFFTFDYDNSPTFTGNRDPNGRVFLQRGFLTIGDLDRSPIYFSIGQMYAPFGQYSSWLVTTPINESVFRILTRTMLLGFSSHGIYAQAYTFTGDRITNTTSLFNQGGFNLGIDHTFNRFEIDLGGGVVSNVADSQGMQNNGLYTLGFFNGFGVPAQILPVIGAVNAPLIVPNLDNLRSNVPGADVHAELTFKPFTLIGEYQWSTRSFNPLDMTFNNGLARPQALHTELDFDFQITWIKFKLAGIYDRSWQSYALNVPAQSYGVALWTTLWKDTAEGIEFRHNTNYAAGTVATGGTINGIPVPMPISNGRPANVVTAQIGVYF